MTVIMLHIMSLVLIYLLTGGLYLLATFIQSPLPYLIASDNHKAALCFYEFAVRFWRRLKSSKVIKISKDPLEDLVVI